ncbi:MAG: AraC family transcriptional regulator [Proteobacteria bacterium]|nr:AraC family transcriptional regulator [Pseudomonadota bacterium]
MGALGVDPAPLLREQGLSAGQLANPEHAVPARAAMRLLENSSLATGCITLGLRMAECRSLANLGATSLLIAHQPTLRQALEALREFRTRVNSTLMLQIEKLGDESILREDFHLRQPEPARQSTGLALGVLARLCSASLGDGWHPRAVCFTHEAPSGDALPIYSRLFRCVPEFNCEFNGIVITNSDLDRPNLQADAQLARHARHLLETVMSPGPRTTAQEVEQLIVQFLPSRRATIHNCAASLGVTVRTLQRMLDNEQASFSATLNRTRIRLATQYLANPRTRVTDVADLLGYNSVGAFSRWFALAFGQSPREWRRHGPGNEFRLAVRSSQAFVQHLAP